MFLWYRYAARRRSRWAIVTTRPGAALPPRDTKRNLLLEPLHLKSVTGVIVLAGVSAWKVAWWKKEGLRS